MSRIFPGYEGGLRPEFRFLKDKAVIIQAWKKAHEYIRAHNWYSDNLDLDLSCIKLEELCDEIQELFSTNAWRSYRPMPMRLVPAPKTASTDWKISEVSLRAPRDFGIRPLAHLTIKDQVIGVMFMCCLANLIETRQKFVRSYSAKTANDSAVSYGNRLLLDRTGESDDDEEEKDDTSTSDVSFLWANSITYDRYYQDYQKFLARPDMVLKNLHVELKQECRYYILSLDLSKCYDRIDRRILLTKIRHEVESISCVDDDFLEALECSFKWSWEENDDSVPIDYAKVLNSKRMQKSCWLNGQIGVPQGLVSGGFLANVYFLSFDDSMRVDVEANRLIELEGGACVRIIDYCRYVDDFRLIVEVSRNSIQDENQLAYDVTRYLQTKIDDLAPGQNFNTDKTRIEAYVPGVMGDSVIRRMNEISARASGPMDMQSAWQVLRQSRLLWPKAQRLMSSIRIGEVEIPQPLQRIKDGTLERYSANLWRREYRILSELLEDGENATSELSLFDAPCALNELEMMAEEFCNQIFIAWLADPSKVRILRIAFDLHPDVKKLRTVLGVLTRMIRSRRLVLRMAGYYVLAEIYRAAAVETGMSYTDKEHPRHQALVDYRNELSKRADIIIEKDVPWYVANQIALFKMVIDGTQNLPSCLTKSCDRIYEVCARGGFTQGVSEGILSYLLFHRQDNLADVNTWLLDSHARGRDYKINQLKAFIARDDLSSAGVAVTSSVIQTLKLSNGKWMNLRDICFSKQNPFDSECAVLRLAKAISSLMDGIEISGYNYYTLSSIEVKCSDWTNISRAWMSVELVARESGVKLEEDGEAFLFQPETWEMGDFSRIAQVGRLIRAAIMQGDEYSVMRRASLTIHSDFNMHDEPRFSGVRSSWLKRRYGLYFDRVCLGGFHVAFSPWLTDLLSGMLCWPGSWCAKKFARMTFNGMIRVIKKRIDELACYAGRASGIPLIPVDINLKKFMKKGDDYKKLQVVVIQNLLPTSKQLLAAKGTLNKSEIRQLRRHESDLLQLLIQTFKTNKYALKVGKSINLIVMPELAIHERDIGFLERFADKMNCIIFAGLVYCQHPTRPNMLINCGMWLIPQKRDKKGRREFVRILQGKGNLAEQEKKVIKNLCGYRPAQWIIRGMVGDKPQWNLSASICYDSTDIKLAADLRDRVDCYIISAFNEDVGTFDAMTEAWRYHMFNHTIVANSGEFGGSTIQAPYSKPYQRSIAHAHGSNQAVVSLAVLYLRKFESRTSQSCKHHPPVVLVPKTPPAGYLGRKR